MSRLDTSSMASSFQPSSSKVALADPPLTYIQEVTILIRSEFEKTQNGIPHRSDYKLTSDIDPTDNYDMIVLGKLLASRCRLQLAVLTFHEMLVRNKHLSADHRRYTSQRNASKAKHYYEIDVWLLRHAKDLKDLSQEPGGDFTLPITWLSTRINGSPYRRTAINALREMLGIESKPDPIDTIKEETETAFAYALGDDDKSLGQIKNSLKASLRLINECNFLT